MENKEVNKIMDTLEPELKKRMGSVVDARLQQKPPQPAVEQTTPSADQPADPPKNNFDDSSMPDLPNAVETEVPKAQPTAPPMATRAKPISEQHPVLQKLEQEFGIKRITPVEVTIGNMTFTLRALSSGMMAHVARLASYLSMMSEEYSLNVQTAIAVCCVSRIDGKPLYQVTDVPLMDDQGVAVTVTDDDYPPLAVMQTAASNFMDILRDAIHFSLSKHIYEEYIKHIDPQLDLDDTLKSSQETDK